MSDHDSRIDLVALANAIALPDAQWRAAAFARQARLTKPAGSLGQLEELSAWLCEVTESCPPRPLDRVRVVVFAGDHGIARTAATSAYPPEVTAQMVLNFIAGGAAVNTLAELNGASVRVVDMAVDSDLAYLGEHAETVAAFKVRRASGSIDREDALTYAEALAAFDAGRTIADQEIDAGVDLLIPGDMGIGNTTPAAALTALLTHTELALVVGRGTGIDDATWMRKTAAVRDATRRGRNRLADPIDLLAAVGGADLAAMTGFIFEAAVRRTPVLLDGVVSNAAALVANQLNYRAKLWWHASHQSTEPAARAALEYLDLVPLIDLKLRLGEGTGALIVLPLLRAAATTLTNMSTFDEAGVSDREAND